MADGTVMDVQHTGEVATRGGRRSAAEARTWGTVPSSVCQGECGTHGPPAPVVAPAGGHPDPLAQLGDRLDIVIALLRDLAASVPGRDGGGRPAGG